MRIDSYSIGMDSARLYKSSSTLRTMYGKSDTSAQGSKEALMSFTDYLGGKDMASEDGSTESALADEAEKASGENQKTPDNYWEDTFAGLRPHQPASSIIKSHSDAAREFQKLRQLMVRHIFDLLFGGRQNRVDEELPEENCNVGSSIPLTEFSSGAYNVTTTTYSTSGYYEESETTKFQAVGEVHTSDGKSININLNISMSRTFATYYEEHFSSTSLNLTDPLVVNFDGNVAGLNRDMDFFFDLDSDGTEEKLASLNAGSAFLALDLNGDGIINDGSELFGTKSGDGFKDLAEYDEDGNGWIDENDSIFTKLKLWTKDLDGNDVLYTLRQKDIGALYLGAAATEFTLADAINSTDGIIRQTGLFLYENGTAGTMQHIDLVS